MKQIPVTEFYNILESSAKYFTDQVKSKTGEDELQTMEQWWYEFKQYMEDM